MQKKIDSILTSCGRYDLLAKTLESFFEFADMPIDNFIVYDDSGKPIPESLIKQYPQIKFIEGTEKVGQIKAIDIIYSYVKNEYIFFQEDDWQFYKTGFIEKSMDILENEPMIMQVWIRSQSDRNGHPVVGVPRMTPNRTRYQMMSSDYRGQWSGHSFNPGLRRLSDYKNLFPNGYAGVTTFNIKEPWTSEMQVGQVYKKAGFKAATLMNGFVKHIGGNGRHISS
jgi:GT2 family glycosyltransferase